MAPLEKPWEPVGATSGYVGGVFGSFPGSDNGFHYELASLGNDGEVSPWGQSMCMAAAHDQKVGEDEHEHEHGGQESRTRKDTRNGDSMFNSECSLWDLQSNDLMNPII